MPLDLRRAAPHDSKIYVIVLTLAAVTFGLLAALLSLGAGNSFNQQVAQWAYDRTTGHGGFISVLNLFADVFSIIGVSIMYAAIAGILVLQKRYQLASWVASTALVTTVVNMGLKHLFRLDRPAWVEPIHEIGGWSFPSGHSSSAGALAAIATLLTIVLTGRGRRRRLLISVWVVIALAVAASRVFLGVHFLTDVVTGLSLGVGVAVAVWLILVVRTVKTPEVSAATTGTGRKQLAVVVNPSKVGDLEEFKERVAAAATIAGWSEPLWFETTVLDPGFGQAQAALEAGVDLILAAGGDGTVRAVCEEVARTGVAVGVLPHGTGNLLARNLGIPLNARDALDVAFFGQDRAIDLATFTTDAVLGDEESDDTDVISTAKRNLTESSFLVMAGLGMDAAIMNGVDDNLKQKVGWAAYFVSGVKAARFPAMKVQISVDGEEFKKFRARTVVVGNVGFLQGGIPLLPDAEIDDGLLDVVILAPKRFIGWLAIIVRVVGRQRRTNDRLDRLTGRKVIVRSEKPVPMQLDGDPVGEGTELTAHVQPGVLLVRVPLAPPLP